MRIHVGHFFWSFNVGGAEKLLLELSKSWKSSSTKHSFFIVNDDINRNLIDELSIYGSVYELKRRRKSNLFSFFAVYAKIIGIIIRGQFNILHAHSPALTKILKPLCSIMRLKLILTVHDVKFSYIKNAEQYFSYADKVLCVSQAAVDYVKKHLDGEDKIILIENSINFSDFRDKVHKKSDLKILTVCRLIYQKKGLDKLLELAEALPKNDFYVVGDGKDKEYFLNKIKIKNISNIKLLGEFLPSDMPEIYSKYDILLMTSTYESFGLVILEAIASELLVVIPDAYGPGEIAKLLNIKSYPPNNSEIIKMYIEEILELPIAARKETTRNLKAQANKKYGIETCSKRYINFYEELFVTKKIKL